jgi:dihydroxyacetone kinase-like protein
MTYQINEIKEIMNSIKEIMDENKDYLIELDQKMGDGDLGLTMSKGFNAACESMAEDEEDIGALLLKASMAMNNAASSTMGTLVSSGIMQAGKTAKGHTEIDDQTFVKMVEEFVDGIKKRGKAEVGDKTILDAVVPAVESLKSDLDSGTELPEAMVNALSAAEEGVEATKEMVSQHGRAHYYGEKSKGKVDPGAVAGMLMFKAVKDYLN